MYIHVFVCHNLVHFLLKQRRIDIVISHTILYAYCAGHVLFVQHVVCYGGVITQVMCIVLVILYSFFFHLCNLGQMPQTIHVGLRGGGAGGIPTTCHIAPHSFPKQNTCRLIILSQWPHYQKCTFVALPFESFISIREEAIEEQRKPLEQP